MEAPWFRLLADTPMHLALNTVLTSLNPLDWPALKPHAWLLAPVGVHWWMMVPLSGLGPVTSRSIPEFTLVRRTEPCGGSGYSTATHSHSSRSVPSRGKHWHSQAKPSSLGPTRSPPSMQPSGLGGVGSACTAEGATNAMASSSDTSSTRIRLMAAHARA